ncbi:adenosine deaminase [Spinactinospora alkalitolerans]|uniref:adenosine deaminase n=1 Tax=Spinactinospora alkalitolerans TaxID=687207 RepID=A0A852TZS6_9ACTN|nr:adenosine deaminase [Spinactinospora alkalitolerans]NYE49331.1 adenosine deaminase [Spinactinospora alkalitolerans]
MNRLSHDTIRRVPKVVLHDHLDGGVRAATLAELAGEAGYDGLPTLDPGRLGDWFAAGAGSPESYLGRFAPIADLLQNAAALTRVATECAQDLAADGVVYAEVKVAPELHTRAGLTREQVVDAVLEGLRVGTARARLFGRVIDVRLLLTAMRQAADSLEIADLAVRFRHRGVVGFDIAGPEAGYPPTRHISACEYVKRENFNLTLHAGEGFGLSSIWEAIQWCGADRLGQGVRIIDDIAVEDGGGAKLGQLAAYVRDKRIPLELCPSSNLHTGAVRSLAEHPIDVLRRLRFRVTVNTDNRLISRTSMTGEFAALAEEFGYTLDDLRWFTVNAMKSAFIGHDERLDLINRVVKPGYAAERADHTGAAFFRQEDIW